MQSIEANQLKQWVHDGYELALLDIREHGEYGEAHLFFAASLPYSALELEIFRLVPLKSTRMVIYGSGLSENVTKAAASALEQLGYTQVFALRGGVEAWKHAGYGLFSGVNLPSKTFGEIAEHLYETPSISAETLQGLLQDRNADIVVVDGRPVEEYRKMNIPGSICCPNGELALRIQDIAPRPETTIVVNCAGRTRSIIGAQTLINLQVPNPVFALENGTQGWFLADLPLEHQSNRLYPESVSPDLLPALRQRSSKLIEEFALETIDAATVEEWIEAAEHNVFLCDIRTREEHLDDAPAFSQHTPGGQLIQATDQYIGVRKSRLVLCDFDGIRAPAVASWLKQLGWPVFLLHDPHHLNHLPTVPVFSPMLEHTHALSVDQLRNFLAKNTQATVLDLQPSQEYRKTHLKGARWAIRSRLQDPLSLQDKASQLIVLIGPSLPRLELAAMDLERAGYRDIHISAVTTALLEDHGIALEHADNTLPDSACIDYLFFVHDRHDGNKAAARKYLEWETNLLSQIDEQERRTFSIKKLASNH